jgi:hypothetical protein
MALGVVFGMRVNCVSIIGRGRWFTDTLAGESAIGNREVVWKENCRLANRVPIWLNSELYPAASAAVGSELDHSGRSPCEIFDLFDCNRLGFVPNGVGGNSH